MHAKTLLTTLLASQLAFTAVIPTADEQNVNLETRAAQNIHHPKHKPGHGGRRHNKQRPHSALPAGKHWTKTNLYGTPMVFAVPNHTRTPAPTHTSMLQPEHDSNWKEEHEHKHDQGFIGKKPSRHDVGYEAEDAPMAATPAAYGDYSEKADR